MLGVLVPSQRCARGKTNPLFRFDQEPHDKVLGFIEDFSDFSEPELDLGQGWLKSAILGGV